MGSITPGDPEPNVAALKALSESLALGVSDLRRQLDDAEKRQRDLASMVESSAAAMKGLAASVQQPLADLQVMREQAQGHLRAIEEDTRKANSESGFAFNAKGNAEAHAKAIAEARGTADALMSSLNATKTNAEDAARAIAQARATAESDVKATTAAKDTTAAAAAQVEAASLRVVAAMPGIEQGAKDASAITALRPSVDSEAAAIQELQTRMADVVAKATSDAAGITKSESEGKSAVSRMVDAADIAEDVTERVAAYETDLKARQVQYEKMHEKLEGLLPHATSAGLASAFHNQKARFSEPRPRWLWLFVGALLALSLASAIGAPTAGDGWDAILRHLANRLPIVGPLVWLAIYAGHHFSMTLRMEEEYAFKEAVSTAFEGYKREMQSIAATDPAAAQPLLTLCDNVLRSLAERPGRIYEGGKADVPTPVSQIEAMLKSLREMVPGKGPETKP